MACGVFKDLIRITASDKRLCDKVFNFAKNLKYYGYQRSLGSMIYVPFEKKTSGSGIKNENNSNKELAEKLHKPINRKSGKIKVHSPFIDNIGVLILPICS